MHLKIDFVPEGGKAKLGANVRVGAAGSASAKEGLGGHNFTEDEVGLAPR